MHKMNERTSFTTNDNFLEMLANTSANNSTHNESIAKYVYLRT